MARRERRDLPRRRRLSRADRFVAVVVVLYFGVLPFFGGGYMLAGALGLVGHRGDFTATSCAVVNSARSSQVECDGNLVLAQRPLVRPPALAAPPPMRHAHLGTQVPLGRATPVQVVSGGPLETLGPAAVSGWSTVVLGGLTVLLAGGLLAFRKRLRKPVLGTVIRVLGVPAGLTLGGLVVYVVVEIVT